MTDLIRVELKLIATLRPYMPAGGDVSVCELHVGEGTRVEDLLLGLGIPPDTLAASALLINGRPCDGDLILQEGDRLVAFPAMAGG